MTKKFIVILFLIVAISCKNEEKDKKNNYPFDFVANVIGVKDGDTVEVLYNEVPIVIRLEHIDCPEKKQAFGAKAKQFTSDFIFQQNDY